ncbi:MAG: CinA-like protein [Bacteroidia bacterium]|nr:MAG: CinA-like protein [Bacteroidia bacterium]
MKALILNIGDELLIGQVVNTNASYIAKQLNLLGIEVKEIRVVNDEQSSILNALEEGQKYNLVIITGGLGPTKDDITKHTLAEFMDDTLIEDKMVLSDIEQLLASRGRAMNELNKQQALVLSQCKVIRNFLGTAPGMLMKKNQTVYISLPGVPFEMKPMLNEALKIVVSELSLPAILHKTYFVFGLPESELALKLEDWENRLTKDGIKLAYLPNRNLIRLRMSVYQSEEGTLKKVQTYAEELKNILGKHFVGEDLFEQSDENPLARVVVNVLKEKKLSIALAESCTGGSIAAAITKIAGASDVFKGGVVSYSNEIKQRVLGVQENTLKNYGAVSKECVEEMVRGVKNLMQVDIALSVSGIAGPTGGTANKPVGTVWMSLMINDSIETKLFQFGEQYSREYIIESAVFNGLAWVLKRILNF